MLDLENGVGQVVAVAARGPLGGVPGGQRRGGGERGRWRRRRGAARRQAQDLQDRQLRSRRLRAVQVPDHEREGESLRSCLQSLIRPRCEVQLAGAVLLRLLSGWVGPRGWRRGLISLFRGGVSVGLGECDLGGSGWWWNSGGLRKRGDSVL